MEKDTRRGKGYWRGCHLFSNIICDGTMDASRPSRDGALKMGGTYWYYYHVDDDIDYYNEAEPWTTSCPFLPGQPTNILHVPIHLPSVESHTRGISQAWQKPAHQTMNPEDKYLNPRPPPRPKLPRLKTSKGKERSREAMTAPIKSSSPSHPVHARSASHPRDPQSHRKFRVPGLTLDIKPASNSGNAIRTAFLNFASPLSGGGRDSNNDRARHGNRENRNKTPPGGTPRERRSPRTGHSRQQSPRWNPNSPCSPKSAARKPAKQTLKVPQEFSGAKSHPASPLRSGHHSESRSQSPFRKPLHTSKSATNVATVTQKPSEGSRAAISRSDTNQHTVMVTCKLDLTYERSSPVDLHSKRLPTLPNSPSSVMEEELRRINGPRLDFDYLNSHFSQSTAASPDSFLQRGGASRFSEWSTDGSAASPSSMTSASTFNNDSAASLSGSPRLENIPEFPERQTSLPPLAESCNTDQVNKPSTSQSICTEGTPCRSTPPSTKSALGLRISGLHITKKSDQNQNVASESACCPTCHSPRLQNRKGVHTATPTGGPPIFGSHEKGGFSTLTTPRVATGMPAEMHHASTIDDGKPGQNIMQEMMDELSYLGDIIDTKWVKG